MRQTSLKCKTSELPGLLKITVPATLLLACFLTDSAAQQRGQKTFSSPEEASKGVVAALQNNDEKAMLEILGPDAKQIVSSGDPIEDAESYANFVRKYQEMHRFFREPDGSVTWYIGAENWPTCHRELPPTGSTERYGIRFHCVMELTLGFEKEPCGSRTAR